MERGRAMARLNDRYSMNRRDKKLAGVCSTIGDVFNIDPTFIRVGFVAAAEYPLPAVLGVTAKISEIRLDANVAGNQQIVT